MTPDRAVPSYVPAAQVRCPYVVVYDYPDGGGSERVPCANRFEVNLIADSNLKMGMVAVRVEFPRTV